MSGIFFSYRRSDSIAASQVDPIHAWFCRSLPFGQAFYDKVSMRSGEMFSEQIETFIKDVSVVLVMIGPGWFQATDRDGHRRLDQEHDWVRREICLALDLHKPIIPVLFGGIQPPPTDQLPEALRPLFSLQIFDFGIDFNATLAKLSHVIATLAPNDFLVSHNSDGQTVLLFDVAFRRIYLEWIIAQLSLGDRIDQQRWLALLQDSDRNVREVAAQALGASGDRLADEGGYALIASLTDSDSYVRDAAAQALGALGNHLSDTGVTALINALNITERNSDVRKAAAQALGALGNHLPDAGVTALITALDNVYPKETVVRALAALGDRVTDAGITALIDILLSPESDKSKMTEAQLATLQALIALKDHVDQQQWQLLLTNSFIVVKLIARQQLELLKDRLTGEDVAVLKDLLGQSNGQVSRAIAQLLVTLGDYIAPEQWQVLAVGNFYLKQAAIQALGLLGDRLTDSGVKMLVEALYDPSSEIRQVAAQALATLEDRVSQQQWQSALMQNFPERRRVAAQALAALGNRISQQQWLSLLTNSDEYVRQTAVQALSALEDQLTDVGMKAIIASLTDSSGLVRWAAVQALSALGNRLPDEGVTAFITGLLKEWSQYRYGMREAAQVLVVQIATTLGHRLTNTEKTTIIQARLSDSYGDTIAKQVLDALGNQVGEEPWLPFLADSSKYARQEAVRALSTLGSLLTDTGVKALLVATTDEDKDVKQAAEEAITALEISQQRWQTFLTDSDWRVRRIAVFGLGALGDKLTDADIMALFPVGNDSEEQVKEALERVLGALEDRVAAVLAGIWSRMDEKKAQKLLNDSDWQKRYGAALALVARGNQLKDAYVKALLKTLAENNRRARQAAMTLLATLGDPPTKMAERMSNWTDADQCLAQLNSKHWLTRLGSVSTLIALGKRLKGMGTTALINVLNDADCCSGR